MTVVLTDKQISRVLERRYALRAEQLDNIANRKMRGVWKVKAGNRLYALKHVRTYSSLTVKLTEHLGRSGLTAKIVPTVSGESVLAEEDMQYMLTEWVDGKPTGDPVSFIKAAAVFHQAAQGLEPPDRRWATDAKEVWYRIYRKRIGRIKEFQESCSSRMLRRTFAMMARVSEGMYADLQAMELDPYIRASLSRGTVVHWDFHRGNVLFVEGSPRILDLDTAEVALQVCDMHQIICDLTEHYMKDPEQLSALLEHYFAANPDALRYRMIYRVVSRFPYYFWTVAERLAASGIKMETERDLLVHAASLELRRVHSML